MVSIKRMETELAELKHEMVLMEKKRSEMEMAMAGINAQIHRSQSKLEEIEVSKTAQQSSVIQIENENIKEVLQGIKDARQKVSMNEILEHETAIELDKGTIPMGSELLPPVVTDPKCSKLRDTNVSDNASVEDMLQEVPSGSMMIQKTTSVCEFTEEVERQHELAEESKHFQKLEVQNETARQTEFMNENLEHATEIEKVATLSPTKVSDIEVNEVEGELEGVKPVNVQLVEIQPTKEDSEAARPNEVKTVVYNIEAIRQQVFFDIEAIIRQRSRLDGNQGMVGDVRNKTLRGGSLRPRKSGLRVLGLSV